MKILKAIKIYLSHLAQVIQMKDYFKLIIRKYNILLKNIKNMLIK